MGSSNSEDSKHSHITVVITPEDLYAACTTACTPERCDNATVRPLEPPLVERGQPGQLIPFEVAKRDPVIRDLPATPIDLLFRYILSTDSRSIYKRLETIYEPGNDLTVDEAMVRFTGRSLETTTIPQKPTPTDYKVWVLGQSGYFVRWLWHVHGRGPCGLVPQQRSRQGDEEVAEEHLTPTQRVVTSLLTLLPLAVYHVFLVNLFASVKLFKALRSSQVGAAGTCRKDSGVDELLVAEKDREGKGIPWGQMHCIPTNDGKVNQFSWKDNALVLFLTTVFREGNQVIRSRQWPAGSSAANRAAREVFGSELGKDLRVPLGIDEYSHHTNGVDTGDQLRSYNQYSRPIRRGGWQSIAWNFLLEVILVNSFLLQSGVSQSGRPSRANTNGGDTYLPN
ncbi:pep1 [Fusarium beomiforme]|uniref:Pep1 n=1 Tax=Fusarium beomiforme TaxID=44412 RepID=A0A9P5AHF3_9HYPO|nr:pep1 [Fusarium beomiforme]